MWWTYSHHIIRKKGTVNWLVKSSNVRNILTSFFFLKGVSVALVVINNTEQNQQSVAVNPERRTYLCSHAYFVILSLPAHTQNSAHERT